MSKRTNPYTALQISARNWARSVLYGARKTMWLYPKARLGDKWSLAHLAERVAAANQLGYDTKLENSDEGLRVVYVQRPPEAPWEFRP